MEYVPWYPIYSHLILLMFQRNQNQIYPYGSSEEISINTQPATSPVSFAGAETSLTL